MGNLWGSFRGLSTLLKVVLAAAILLALIAAPIFLVLLSPLMIFLALLAFAIFTGVFLFRLLSRRHFARNWGIAAASSFILIFVFAGISGVIYGGGEPTEVAEREQAIERTKPEETTTVEETTQIGEDEEAREEEEARGDREREEKREREAAEREAAERETAERAALAEREAAEQEQREEQEAAGSYDATVTITSVTDGDTVEVSPAVNGYTDVRLIGMDTPEVFFGTQPYGAESSAFATQMLEGQTVELELDVEEVDDFDRLLAYVWIGDELFNETLVEEGYAQVATFPPNTAYEGDFIAAQEEARAAGLGIWGLSVPEQCQLADRGNGIGEGSAACLMPEDPVAPAPGIDEPPMQESAPAPEPAPDPYVPTPAPAPLPAPAPPSAPSEAGGDIDCDQVSEPIPTPPGDPDGLDGDGDGLACE